MFFYTYTPPKPSVLRTFARTATITFISKGSKCAGEFIAKHQQERGVCKMIQGQGNGRARKTSQKVWPSTLLCNTSLSPKTADGIIHELHARPFICQNEACQPNHWSCRNNSPMIVPQSKKKKDIKWSHFRGLPSSALDAQLKKGRRKKIKNRPQTPEKSTRNN